MHLTQPDDLIVRLLEADKPTDVVYVGAACLAGMLDGFGWVRSRHSLERRVSVRREVLQLEKSKRNRSGHLIEFTVASLTVFDEDLGAWRRANSELTVRRPESVESIVCASSFLDMPGQHSVVLTRPEERLTRLEQFAAHLRDTALPWFASTADPAQLARTAPDALLTAWGFAQDLIEFLVSTGHHLQAQALWDRVQEHQPAHRQAFVAGRTMAGTGERPRWHTPEALGWSASVLDLL
ncbi:hypothetical protein HUT16_34600 [Kitasatospora sp. NA04385]|uniref:hypothetical protein n=1 Tax=Kitasatospora sp. NA04385 TaxID=2742135 RepID=UPI00158FBDF0|nr:hypothetical protein [Kitasatospora sp. NA04385]QKW23544.1 hypothetical protein HUT16_34600 [Kitasatospora sp. NA04385]